MPVRAATPRTTEESSSRPTPPTHRTPLPKERDIECWAMSLDRLVARRNLVASSAGVPLYCSSDCERAGPVCDFCVHYRFNGDAAGWHTGEGVCAHPEHPGPMDP